MTQRYDTYKDSGVQWLGEIPGHWGTRRAKYLLKLLTESTKRTRKIGLENIESNTGKLILTESIFDGDGVDFDCGDILYGKLRPYLNKVWLAEFEGNAVGDFYVYRAINDYLNSFAKYLLLSSCFVGISNASTYGAKMPRVSSQFIHSLHFPVPPLSEQRSIVSYLDAKCGMIDEWVSKKQKEVEHLQELKQRVIADAVTRGLNPHVKMKQTVIPWLPEVPEHWDVLRLKSLFDQRSESYNPDETLQVLSLLKDIGVIPYDEKGSIGNKSKEDYSQYKVTRKGDIVMNSMNVIIGSVDITSYDGYISPAYYALCAKDGICTEYYNYIFHLKSVQKTMRSLANGILEIRLRISTTNLFGMYYPVPPLSEQKQIVAHITYKTSKIDKLIANITKEIERIKEYKQRLISDVVTGQIKVC